MTWVRCVFEAPNHLPGVDRSDTYTQLAKLNFIYGVSNIQEALKLKDGYSFPSGLIRVDDGIVFMNTDKVKKMTDPLYLRYIH